MKYSWKPMSMIRMDAQKTGERIHSISEKNGGRITPDVVVKEAKKKSSPLHAGFDWDDTVAAHEFRLETARRVLRSIVVQINPDEGSKPIKAFVHLTEGDIRNYVSTVVAMSNEELRTQVLRNAWRELESFKQKYQEYEELAAVFAAMERSQKVA